MLGSGQRGQQKISSPSAGTSDAQPSGQREQEGKRHSDKLLFSSNSLPPFPQTSLLGCKQVTEVPGADLLSEVLRDDPAPPWPRILLPLTTEARDFLLFNPTEEQKDSGDGQGGRGEAHKPRAWFSVKLHKLCDSRHTGQPL